MQYQASRLDKIKSSPSMAVSQAAKKMISEGIDVVDLSLGEPDFKTPDNIISAAISAMRNDYICYTGPNGIPKLREAIVDKLKTDNQLDYHADEITVANGAKQIIYSALMATLEPDDEVVILAPYFVSYPDMVLLHGGKPIIVPCAAENNFVPTREALKSAMNERTRWVIINTPSNPSGAIMTFDELRMIGEIVKDYPRAMVMSDEIYEKICFDDSTFVSFGQACPELKDRSLIINGVSKSYAMTGWRIGYAAGPKGMMSVMNKLQSQSTTSPCYISQIASIEALSGDQSFVDKCRARYQSRRNLILEGLKQIPELKAFVPAGAFYIFADCAELIGKVTPQGTTLENDTEVATYLLQQGKVASVPGTAYGLESYIRFSFATSEELLNQALANLITAINLLK